jgi:hypothetical protein
LPQGFAVFYKFRVNRDTGYGTDLHALGLIEMTHALGAFMGVNFINLLAHINGIVRALGFADVTVDAFIGNDQSHCESFKSQFALWAACAPTPKAQQIARRRLAAWRFL